MRRVRHELERRNGVDRAGREQREVVGLYGFALRPLRRQVERKNPATPVWRERDFVLDRLAGKAHFLRRKRLRLRPPPAAPVEFVQHGTAPVALLRLRQSAGEARTEGHLARDAQVRHVARRHRVVEPGACVPAGFDTPERAGQTREQHEQQQRQRQGLQQQRARARREVSGRGPAAARVYPHECHGGQECTAGEPRQLQQALVAQQRRVQQEPRDESEDRHVARPARFQQLYRRHEHQEGGAGLDAIECPVGGEDACGGGEKRRRVAGPAAAKAIPGSPPRCATCRSPAAAA